MMDHNLDIMIVNLLFLAFNHLKTYRSYFILKQRQDNFHQNHSLLINYYYELPGECNKLSS